MLNVLIMMALVVFILSNTVATIVTLVYVVKFSKFFTKWMKVSDKMMDDMLDEEFKF